MIVGEKSAYWWNTSVIYSDGECRNVMIGKTVRPGYECFKSAHSFSLFLNYTLFTTMPSLQTYGERPVVLLTVRASAPARRADVCRTTTARPATPRRTFIRLRERWRASSGGMCGW